MSSWRRLPKLKNVGDREKHLIELSRCLRVVHIGCTDWPFQSEQISSGNFLHTKLQEVASDILGVDVDYQGISELIRNDSSGKFIVGDFSNEKSVFDEIVDFNPDVILVPDVLEHVENQGIFLRELIRLSNVTRSKLVLTTPNAFSLKTFLPLLLGFDFTHPDHRIMHNEATLMRALVDHTTTNSFSLRVAQRNIGGRYGFTAQLISSPFDVFSRIFPQFGDTLVAEIVPS